jgi:Mn2+/Fe2+ NRAMP family transporter
LSETFGFPACINKKIKEAKFFYLAIFSSIFFGLLLSFLPLGSIDFLFYTGVIFAILSPPLIFLILLVSNNKKIMGEYKNGLIENALGITTLLIMTIVVILSFI